MSLRVLHYSDLETALDDPEQCARLAGAIEARRDADAVVVGTGDNTAPGALSMATRGRIALPFFEAVAPAAEVFGNHDFDYGPETARELAAESPMPWLCANARMNGERFAADATERSRLVETSGHTVGIVGVSHPETATFNPAAEGVTFHDPVPPIREAAARLRERGAKFVIVASHCGPGDERIARETDVDAVLGGHVHDVHVETVDGTFVVRPGRAGRYLSEVTLGDGADVTVHEVTDEHRDPAVASAIGAELERTGLGEVVAAVDEPIERSEEAVTVGESRVGNLVVDAMRWRTDADVAVSVPGALRSGDPLDGDVTAAELIGLAPYEDDLCVLALSGERLREVLARIPLGAHGADYPDRFCGHLSGASIVFDDETATLREATVGGEPLDLDREYRLAVADYVVVTDHVHDVFGPGDVIEEHGQACRAIVDYAREKGIAPEIEGRIERPTLGRGQSGA